MIIKTLVENTSVSEEFRSEHGLSLYIETKNHKLLFDLGASNLLIENAKKLGVDLSAVDLVVISHGHYDHGGGIKAFFNVNSHAKIYLNEKAFGEYYTTRPNGINDYIGLDQGLMPNNRFIFARDHIWIDEELTLFSKVKGNKLIPMGNKNLLMKSGALLVQDNFEHEQNLIIKDEGMTFLVAACSHNGIVNIVDRATEVEKNQADYVIGGFHLYNRIANQYESPELINQIGEYLKSTGSMYYTCHCTGIKSYEKLKESMGEKIQYLAAGSTLIL